MSMSSDVKRHGRDFIEDDAIYMGLESRHRGISDSAIGIVLDMIPTEQHAEFHNLLDQMSESTDIREDST